MDTIQKPMQSSELGYQQAIARLTRVADEMTQSLASIMGYSVNQRVLLKASPTGVLYTAKPQLVEVFHWLSVGNNEAHQGVDVPATEILCMAHPDNQGRIWVRTNKAATDTNAFPLDKGDVFTFTVDNLNKLFALIVAGGESLIVGYSM